MHASKALGQHCARIPNRIVLVCLVWLLRVVERAWFFSSYVVDSIKLTFKKQISAHKASNIHFDNLDDLVALLFLFFFSDTLSN